jgi:Uncharacterised nucleotidyltransferase
MTARPRLPPLTDTLGLMLPDAQDTLLLRACLGDGAGAAEAWQAWLATSPGLPTVLVERPRSRRFLPLLFHVLSAHGIAVAEPSLSILRAATLWEERRAVQLRPILVQVLASLRGVGVGALLLKGAALAETAYPRFWLRHCHDLDLLVGAEALPAAREALLAAGFWPVAAAGSARGQGSPSLALQHEGGLPVNLHTKLWAAPAPDGMLAAFRRRGRTIDIDGEPVAIFAPMDMLLHVCGHAGIGAGPGNWTWIADAAMIVRRHSPSAGEWAGLVRIAAESGIAVALAVRFSELAARFDLPIPVATLNALVDAAWRSSSGQKDAAISAARAASGVPFLAMLRQSGWRSRIEIARWALRRSRRLVRAW